MPSWIRPANASQVGILYEQDRDRTVIGRHTRNLFPEHALEQESDVQKLHIADAGWPTASSSLDMNCRSRYVVMKVDHIVESGSVATSKDSLVVPQT